MRRGTLALVAIVILAYLPVLRAGFIWDDDSYVEHNASLRTAGGLWHIWTDRGATPQYYPLVHTTFWVEYHLWGVGSATPFHATNLLLHAAAAVLLWRLLGRLGLPAPGVGAAVWAVHPLQVESVAWVTERKNVLSAVFYLLAFGAYLTASEGGARLRRRWYAVALGCFVLALCSKTVTATLPAAVLLAAWWRRGTVAWRDVVPLVPFFVAGGLLGLNTGYLERVHVGARGPEFAFTWADRVLIAGRAVWFYAAKLAVPWPLAFIYPRWAIDRHQAWQYLFPVAVAAAVAALWLLRRRVGRGPLAGALFFGGTLFPALGFANVYPMRYAFVADHFQYLAGVGLLALAAAAASRVRALPAALVIACAAATFARTLAYQDRVTLWTDTVGKNPGSWMAHTNLGHALVDADRIDAAWVEYQTAARLAPHLAEPHFNLAMGYARQGDYPRAAAECRLAIDADPNYAPAYANLGKVLVQQDDLPGAIAAATRAIQLAPTFPVGHYALARAIERSGRLREAEAEYRAAIDLNPDDAEAHRHLGDVLGALGQPGAAVPHYAEAAALSARAHPR